MKSNSRITTGIARPRRPLPLSMRLALVGVVAIIGFAGCNSSTTSPSAQLSAPPSAVPTATSTPTTTLAPTPTRTQTPKPTPTSTPKPTPTTMPMPKFVPTGSMHIGRLGDTATLLQNGKVLIAGGGEPQQNGQIFSSAELYDPTTGRFTKTGSMRVARSGHTATLLQNGKVLIAGGGVCTDKSCIRVNSVASAELYDPNTGKFSLTGSMATPRGDATATLLRDGRVLLAEGDYGGRADLYDPNSGKFTPTGNEIEFDNPSATLLSNGNVLVTGGDIRGPHYGALYDEARGKFTKISLELAPGTAPVIQFKGQDVDRAWPGPVTVLKDGRVLLFEGGYLVTYDPATGKCAASGFISPAGDWMVPTATLLKDGRVLFAGGQLTLDPATNDDEITNTAVVYDPTSGSQATGSMKEARLYPTATLLSNGNVLIAGDGNSAELLKP